MYWENFLWSSYSSSRYLNFLLILVVRNRFTYMAYVSICANFQRFWTSFSVCNFARTYRSRTVSSRGVVPSPRRSFTTFLDQSQISHSLGFLRLTVDDDNNDDDDDDTNDRTEFGELLTLETSAVLDSLSIYPSSSSDHLYLYIYLVLFSLFQINLPFKQWNKRNFYLHSFSISFIYTYIYTHERGNNFLVIENIPETCIISFALNMLSDIIHRRRYIKIW